MMSQPATAAMLVLLGVHWRFAAPAPASHLHCCCTTRDPEWGGFLVPQKSCTKVNVFQDTQAVQVLLPLIE